MMKRIISTFLCLILIITPTLNVFALEIEENQEYQYEYYDNGDGTHDGNCIIDDCDYSVTNEAHDFVDGKCSKCGAIEETDTVNESEDNSSNWEDNGTHSVDNSEDIDGGDSGTQSVDNREDIDEELTVNDETDNTIDDKKDEDIYPAFEQSKTVDGVKVSVTAPEGVFPADAKLSVITVSTSDKEYAEDIVGEVREDDTVVAVSYTFDIKVLDSDGNEMQPDDDQSVIVTFSTEEVADSNLETDVYHISDDGEVEKLLTETNDDEVSAETDGFSYYTVEFTYHELQYVMEGYTCICLQDILDVIKIEGVVTDVECSDTSLFEAKENEGEWVISSLQPFTSDEWMKVTINDIVYEIKVTDDQGSPIGNAIHAAAENEWNKWKGSPQSTPGISGRSVLLSQNTYYGNSMPYGNDCNNNWCDRFVKQCLIKAGAVSSSYKGWGDSGMGYRLVRDGFAEYVTSGPPMPGDLVEYKYGGSYKHIAIVDKVINGRVMTFQGNVKNKWAYMEAGDFSLGGSIGYSYQLGYIRLNNTSTPMPDPQPQDHNPKFTLDSATSNSPGTITVRGWAFDPDDTSAKLKIKVYGGPGGSYLGELTANKSRPDVNNVYGCGNNHGFEGTFNLEWDATWTGKVYVNIINVGSGSNETSPRITVTVKKDTVPPTIKDLEVSDVSPDGCTLTCSVTDNLEVRGGNIGVKKEVHDENGNVYSDKMLYVVNYSNGKVTCNLTPYDRPGHIYVFTVYATDIQGNTSSKSITVDLGESSVPEPESHDPIYFFDSATSKTPGTVTVRGWAYDPDDIDAKLNITVWGGPGMFKLGTTIADKTRNDVNDIYGCGKNHGFEATFPIDWNGEWPDTQRVYVEIANVGNGNDVTSAQKSYTVAKDTVPPTISSLRVTDISPEGCTLTCAAADNVAVKDVWVKKEVQDDEGNTYTDNLFYTTTESDGIYTVNLKPYTRPGHIYKFTVEATDMQGNSTTESITVDLENSNSTDNHDPVYSFETVSSDSPGMITVRGWAFDPDDTAENVSVRVHGGPGMRLIVGFVARKTRPDVNDTYGCGNDHGFEETFPVMWAGTDKVYIEVINVGEGEDVTSAQKTVTVEKFTIPPSILNLSATDISSTGCQLTCSVSDDMKIDNVWVTKEVIDDNGDSYSDNVKYAATLSNGVYKIDLEPYDRPGHIYKFTVVATDIQGNSTSKTITVDLENPNTPVTGITLDRSSENVVISDEFTLRATISPADATNKNITWSSDDPRIAIVDQNGKVTAVSTGSTDIVATTDDGGLVAKCEVAVAKQRLSIIDFIVLFPDNTVYDGNEKEVTVMGGPSDYNGVVSIDYFDDSGIALSGAPKAVGSYKFVLVAAEDQKYVGLRSGSSAWTFSITESNVPVTSVSLSKTSMTLSVDETSTLRANVLPEDASNKNVVWSSDNPNIATVSQNGLVKAVAPGETYINVTTDSANKTARCKVIVIKEATPIPSSPTPSSPTTPAPRPSSGRSSSGSSSSSSSSSESSSNTGSSSGSGATQAPADPNAISVVSFIPGTVATGAGAVAGDVKISNQEQGPVAKFLFKLFTPSGWKEAFTFNMTVNGIQDYSLKKGKLSFYVPPTYRKQGRVFALISIVKPGQIKYLLDTDKNPDTITVDLDCEGYAFDLIYFDLPTITKK